MTTGRRQARACRSLLRIRLAEQFQYRFANLSTVAVGVFWACIEVLVLSVFYTHADGAAASVNGLTLPMAVSYIWVGQAVYAVVGYGMDGEISQQIARGDVALELCRPMDLYFHWFVKTAAGRLGGLWQRGPLVLLCALVMPGAMRLGPPASAAALFLFLLSLSSAVLLSCAWAMLVTAVRLNITWGMGPVHLLFLVSMVLSGSYLPLQLWPDALQRLLLLQPFAGLADIPLRLYVGAIAAGPGLGAIATQLLWTAAFVLAGRLLMRRQLKTLIIQGG